MPRNGDRGAVRVAENILRRQGGTFGVSVSVNMSQRRASFPTLEEAIAWRDAQYADRKPREARRGAPSMSTDVTEERNQSRLMIKTAPRTKAVIDGKQFTVVHLPGVEA
jgi:hypothetical protein